MTGGGLQPARHFWLPLAIIGVLAALTAWLGQLADEVRPAGDAGVFGHHPDYFVEDFKATAFDVDGSTRYRLSARKMVHFMDDDSTTLDEPRFSREGQGMPDVHVRSRRGLVSSDGENVYFLGEVRMEHAWKSDRPPLRLATEYLRVVPDANLIRTDRPVTLSEGRSTLSGGGMEADGDSRTLILAGRVRGVYESRR